jgi:chemotaxis protein methyltransferase CheR
MILPRASAPPKPIPFQEPVPQLLRDLVHERLGIYFESSRLDLMMEKLEPRARAQGCRSYLDYYYLLRYDEKGKDEWRRVMDAFSVQETYFWREFDQVKVLVERILPPWFARNPGRPFRIWSAACATGEEPYTIAMALAEAGWGAHPIEIIASDASEAALAKARASVYRDRSFRALPLALKLKYFETRPEGFFLRPEITSRVKFAWANLMRLDDLAEAASADAIFCRNVFIYFSPAAITQVVGDFARRLPPGAPLFVGASESLLKLTDQFDLQQLDNAFVYERKVPALN